MAQWTGYKPHSLQSRVLASPSRFRLVVAGRRWGKSLSAAWEALTEALLGGRVWVVGLTYEQTDRILEPIWTFLATRKGLVADGTRRSDRRIVLPGGGFIVGKSADHADSLVGESLTLAILDEAPVMSERIWSQMIRPCLSDRHGRALMIGTPRGHNWIFDRYSLSRRDDQPDGEPEWYAWHAPSWTNDVKFPGGKNDPEMVSVRDEAERSGLLPLWSQEYGADFTALQGRVYSRWNRAEHVVSPQAASQSVVSIIGGADWGHRDPCALVVCGKTNDSQWRILDEWYIRGATHPEVMLAMDALSDKWHVGHWWCDGAEPARIAECKRRGLDARFAWKDPGSKNGGIMLLAPFLGRPGGFMVSSACKNLIREIESYSWDEAKHKEATQDNDDHAMDAMRYAIATEERKTRKGGLAIAYAH